MKAFQKLNVWITKVFGTISLAFVALMTITIVIQVFYRYVLNTGLVWTDETARFLNIWVCMLGAAILVFDDAHIKVSLFEDTWAFLRRPFQLLQRILILVYSLFMLYLAIDCLSLPAASAASPAMKAPMMLVYIVYPFFGAAAVIHSVWRILVWFKPEYDLVATVGEEDAE